MAVTNNFFVLLDEKTYELTLSSVKFSENWIFTIDDLTNPATDKLLPHTIYIHLDLDKNFLSCFPTGAVAPKTVEVIVQAIKNYQYPHAPDQH